MAGAPLPYFNVGATVIDVAVIPCWLRGKAYNRGGVTAYVQLFFKPKAEVTLGTTAPDHVAAIRPGVSDPLSEEALYIKETVSAAVTTTPTGATAGAADLFIEVS